MKAVIKKAVKTAIVTPDDMGEPVIFVGPQLADGTIINIAIYANGTTIISTPLYNGGEPGSGPYTIEFSPTTPLMNPAGVIQALLTAVGLG